MSIHVKDPLFTVIPGTAMCSGCAGHCASCSLEPEKAPENLVSAMARLNQLAANVYNHSCTIYSCTTWTY